MYKLESTKTIETYAITCPHCRSTIEHPASAFVVIERNEKGQIVHMTLSCPGTLKGQDRT